MSTFLNQEMFVRCLLNMCNKCASEHSLLLQIILTLFKPMNGTKRLYVFLSIIFTLFLSHGFTPDSLILGTIIPIPKDKKKYFFSSSNYRAIALSSILNKILDWIILLKEHKSLSSSPLQFGFKKGLSTTQCTHSLLENVDYNNYNKFNVFVLMLDAIKAFDIVRYCKFLTDF